MADKRSKEEWGNIVDEYRKSGQTMIEWCRGRGINVKTLGNHTRGQGRRNTRSAQEWAVLIAEQKSSGVGRAVWCNERGINAYSMETADRKQKARERDLEAGKPAWVEIGGRPVTANAAKEEIYRQGAGATDSGKGDTAAREYSAGAINKEYDAAVPSEPQEAAQLHREVRGDRGPLQAGSWRGSVKIRARGLEIEADAGYPAENLIILIGRLVKQC